MAAGPELLEFQDNLARVHAPIETVAETIDSLGDKVDTVQFAIEALRDLQRNAHTLSKTIDSLESGLKFVGLAPPLKSASKLGINALQALEKVVDAVDAKTLALVKAIDGQKIPAMLDKVGNALDKAADKIEPIDDVLTVAEDLTEGTVITLDLFDRVANLVDPTDSVHQAVEGALRVPNQVAATVEDHIDQLASLLGRVDDAVAVGALKPVTDMVGTLNSVGHTLSKLASPLNKAVKALKPIEDLLDAGGLVYKWTVEPVVDWIIDKVGLKKAINTAVNQIKALIPDASVITKATDGLNAMFGALDDLLDGSADPFGLDALAQQLSDAVNDAVDSPVLIGTERADTLSGDDGMEVLNALGGHDRIDAGGGDDLIVAGGGNDVIDGGAGTDVLLLRGARAEYTLAVQADGSVTVTHAQPADRALSDGIDQVRQVEMWSFADGTFPLSQLVGQLPLTAADRAPAPPPLPTGPDRDLPADMSTAVTAVAGRADWTDVVDLVGVAPADAAVVLA